MILAAKEDGLERDRLAGGVRSHPRRPARRHGGPVVARVLREVEAGTALGYAAVCVAGLPLIMLIIALSWVMAP